VNLLNFMATSEGLQDQMLGIVVQTLETELEKKREALVLQDAANQRELKALEDRILKMLAEASGDILEDDELIRTLDESKHKSDEIMQQVKVAEKTQKRINVTRQG